MRPACSTLPEPDRNPDPLQKTAGQRAAHRPAWSTLPSLESATRVRSTAWHGGNLQSEVQRGRPNPPGTRCWPPETSLGSGSAPTTQETSQQCVATPGLGEWGLQLPGASAARRLPVSPEALPATVAAGVKAGVVVGVAPWAGPRGIQSVPGGPVGCPCAHPFLRRPGGFPSDLICPQPCPLWGAADGCPSFPSPTWLQASFQKAC